MKRLSLILADDHQIFLDGLVSLLEKLPDIKITGTATNGLEVLALLKTSKADIIITDVGMPVMDGLELTKRVKLNHPHVKILALTMHNEAGIIAALVKAGADGYILKDAGKEELQQAILVLTRGEKYFADEVKNTIMDSMKPASERQKDDPVPELTVREKEILKFIAEELGQDEIAEKLCISPHTVKFHRKKLLHKFNAKNTAGMIRKAAEQGLL